MKKWQAYLLVAVVIGFGVGIGVFFLQKIDKNTTYQNADVTDTQILSLYADVLLAFPIGDNYVANKITNDTIISVVVQKIDNLGEFEVVKQDENKLVFKIDAHTFEKTVKDVFGENIKYELSSYSGQVSDCASTYYDKSSASLIMETTNQCGFDNYLVGSLVSALENDKELIITEESLYVHKLNDTTYEIYDNYQDKNKLGTEESMINESEVLKKYSGKATKYNYKFKKMADNKYIYVDFGKAS